MDNRAIAFCHQVSESVRIPVTVWSETLLLDVHQRNTSEDQRLWHGQAVGKWFEVLGTPLFMAPEILAEKPYSINADVYS